MGRGTKGVRLVLSSAAAVAVVLAGWLAALALAGGGGGGVLSQRAAVAQQQDFSKVEIKVTPVAGKVYMLEGAGGNMAASVGEDGILLVDDQFEPLAPKIRAALLGIAPGGKLRFVVNTHWHGDHTGGNRVFGLEAPILAQTNVRKRLSAEQTVMGNKVPPSPKEALPVLTYDQSVSVHWNGEEIKLVHFPHGHTDGDTIVFFTGANVVHMGDDFFAGRYPFIDLGTGGSVQGLIDNVAKALAQMPADAKVIPGHGPLSAKADLERFHAMLVTTTGIVRHRMQAGESLEKMQAEGLPADLAPWGQGFVDAKTWILTIHDSLAKDASAKAPAGHPRR
ncbi:MAG TPA: MBL fold metallo-hydrolase [Thermoanaerobaculia bacterium]|nr:MBL fold metallo-hydrolase [Thermoanaerobaculia bacterium]